MPLVGSVLYGVPNVSKIEVPMFWKLLRGFFIPVIFVIGMIIYFRKSKKSVKRKIVTAIIVVLLLVAICFGINNAILNSI